MGIGDRAYMRNQRLARDPISVTAWTVGILVGFFILTLVQESAHADFLDWMPLTENKPAVWQWLSYALLHGGFWHLLGNCLVLWWTGATVEKEQGPVIFLKVLVGGALIGALTWYLSGLGGLVFGWLAWRYLNRTSQAPFYAQVQEPMSTNAPSPAIEPETEGFPSGSPPTPGQARAEMDSLLDKISAGGFGSLTAGEKRRLEELSARLR